MCMRIMHIRHARPEFSGLSRYYPSSAKKAGRLMHIHITNNCIVHKTSQKSIAKYSILAFTVAYGLPSL